MTQKESKDLCQKINISSGEKKSSSSNSKQYKMKNKQQKNIVKKNYRVITSLDIFIFCLFWKSLILIIFI